MKKIIALAIVGIMAASCGQQPEQDKHKQLEELKAQYTDIGKKIKDIEKELATTDTNSSTTPIKTVTLAPTVFKHPVDIQGVVESDKNVIVSSEVAGRIVEVYVKEGQSVSEGQLLVRVNGDITANSIAEVENALKLAEITYKKQKALREQNVGTEMQLLQAENNRDALKKQLETLRAQYAKYSITSPVSGIVEDVPVNSGESILPGLPVAHVVNNSQLKVKAEVSEKYITAVKTGDSVMIKFPGVNNQTGAKVSAVGQTINTANRTFSLTINLTKSNPTLKPNLLAMVTIYDYVQPNAVVVPSNVITTDGIDTYVFVVENQGGKNIAKKAVIKTGITSGAFTEIISGLKHGDVVVTENYKNLSEGSQIEIIK